MLVATLVLLGLGRVGDRPCRARRCGSRPLVAGALGWLYLVIDGLGSSPLGPDARAPVGTRRDLAAPGRRGARGLGRPRRGPGPHPHAGRLLRRRAARHLRRRPPRPRQLPDRRHRVPGGVRPGVDRGRRPRAPPACAGRRPAARRGSRPADGGLRWTWPAARCSATFTSATRSPSRSASTSPRPRPGSSAWLPRPRSSPWPRPDAPSSACGPRCVVRLAGSSLGAAAGVGALVTLPLYDVPLAAVVAVLLVASCAGFAVAERARAAVRHRGPAGGRRGRRPRRRRRPAERRDDRARARGRHRA